MTEPEEPLSMSEEEQKKYIYKIPVVRKGARLDDALATIEEWMKEVDKCKSSELLDPLVSLFAEVLDAMYTTLKSSDRCSIQRALTSLDRVRSCSMKSKKYEPTSILFFNYGVIHSIHRALAHLTEERNHSEHSEESLKIVEEWKRKISDFKRQSADDSLVPVFIKAFDVFFSILKISDQSHIQLSFELLEVGISTSMESEEIFDSIRLLSYGVIKSAHSALLYMIEERNKPREEPIVDEQSIPLENQNYGFEFREFKEEDREEEIVIPGVFEASQIFPDDNQIPLFIDSPVEARIDEPMDSSQVISDDNQIESTNKEVSESKSSKATTRQSALKCPECPFEKASVSSWINHLRYEHNTDPNLSGLALLCACGNESLSARHKTKNECDVASFTVIRKQDGPIRRFGDVAKKLTPQCVFDHCDKYPRTILDYIAHLRNHKTTLEENGVYLKCSCGVKVFTNPTGSKAKYESSHGEKCCRRQFTLHKL